MLNNASDSRKKHLYPGPGYFSRYDGTIGLFSQPQKNLANTYPMCKWLVNYTSLPPAVHATPKRGPLRRNSRKNEDCVITRVAKHTPIILRPFVHQIVLNMQNGVLFQIVSSTSWCDTLVTAPGRQCFFFESVTWTRPRRWRGDIFMVLNSFNQKKTQPGFGWHRTPLLNLYDCQQG